MRWSSSGARSLSAHCRIATTRMKASGSARTSSPHWDRNAPLPEKPERVVPWAEAQSMVLKAYGGFAPEMAAIAKRVLRPPLDRCAGAPGQGAGRLLASDGALGAPVRAAELPGQAARRDDAGARARPRRASDAGARRRAPLLAPTPLTLAETASVFGEMLTFQALLDETQRRRKSARRCIAGKVEDMLNTVVRQIAFYTFERKVHEERRQGELTPDQLGAHLARGAVARASGRPSISSRATRSSGPTSRTSSIRRSTSTPMPSAIAW